VSTTNNKNVERDSDDQSAASEPGETPGEPLIIYGNARVYGDAWIYGDAEVFEVSGFTKVLGDADPLEKARQRRRNERFVSVLMQLIAMLFGAVSGIIVWLLCILAQVGGGTPLVACFLTAVVASSVVAYSTRR